MVETTSNPEAQAAAQPRAVVTKKSRVSLVWLVPVAALVIGAWLAYKAFSEQGPIITVRFNSASGLQAGKTKVKLKDVDIGQVTSIDVGESMKHVVVTAELKHGTDDYLTDGTRFWVARPRITASRVSGLETVLSGAYIAIDPVLDGAPMKHFTGLEEPPLFTTSEPGTKFVLRSETLGSLNIGSPVYYRQIQVGHVVGYGLEDDDGREEGVAGAPEKTRRGRDVMIDLFIGAPHDRLVLNNTRFWNASGVDFTLSADGVKVDTQSVLAVLIGGVAFDTPDTLDASGKPAEPEQVFPLYASREKAHERIYAVKERFLLRFEGSVRGLAVGAPVMLRGIRIGQVLDIQLQFERERLDFVIPVLVEIEPDRIAMAGEGRRERDDDRLGVLVEKGLRAQLKSGSLLTGALFVDFDFHSEAEPAVLTTEGAYAILPTVPAPLEAITAQVNRILARVEAFPLEQIGTDLQQTLAGTSAIVNSSELESTLSELDAAMKQARQALTSINTAIAPELAATLRQTRVTLKATEDIVVENSPMYVETQRMLQELSAAARSIRVMADYLERHPEALIKGKRGAR